MKIAAHRVVPIRVTGPLGRDAFGLMLWDETGRVGLGEAAPIQGFSPEDLNQVERALKEVGTHLKEIDEAGPLVDSVERVLAPFASALRVATSAQFAIETALFDLFGQRSGRDVASSLRGSSTVFPTVATSALLRGAGDATFVKRGRIAIGRGFRALKVKLRADDDETLHKEIAGLRALRAVAPDIELRLDPNGRWSVEDARRRLSMLAEVRPAYVEQPVSPDHLLALGPCDVPWAADESLLVSGVAESLSLDTGCVAWVLKPAALGLLRAQVLAKMAFSKGFRVAVTHFFDGPVGLSAACELALSLDEEPMASGLDPHAGLRSLPPSLLPHHADARLDFGPNAPHIQPTGKVGLGLGDVVDSVWTTR